MIYKKTWKYILIRNESNYLGSLYRPKALKDFSNVSKNHIGGVVKGYHNLSQKGDCWVYYFAGVIENAQVSENAKVCGDAVVKDDAQVFGSAVISGHSVISGNTVVSGNTEINNY